MFDANPTPLCCWAPFGRGNPSASSGQALTSDGKVYTYTQANRLTTVSGTGLSWSATYNGDGARLRHAKRSTARRRRTCSTSPRR